MGFVGALGGILLMWDKRIMEKVDEVVGVYSFPCSFKILSYGLELAFSGVYGSNCRTCWKNNFTSYTR